MPAAAAPAPANGRRTARVLGLLALVFAGAFALRAVVMERTFPPKPLGDEMYYVVVATNIAAGRGHVYGSDIRALRPPAHAWLLSLVTDPGALMPEDADGARRGRVELHALRPLLRLEVVLGSALVLATAALAWALFDARTALVAAALAAVYPTFIAYSHFLWSETLFALLVTTALAGIAWMARERSGWLAPFVGAAFGAAALTREVAIPVAIASVGWAVVAAPPQRRRAALLRGGVVFACATLVVTPWVIRNHQLFARILPISSVGWVAIGEGNALAGSRWLRPAAPGRSEFRREVNAVSGELARGDLARRLTLETIAAEQPGWLFRKLAHNLPLMLSPDAFQLYKLRNGSYGDVPVATRRAVSIVTVLAYVLVACLGAIGIASARSGRRRLLALLVLGCVLALHVVANANSRFRMPWMPLVMVFAAHAALGGRVLLASLRPAERVGAGVAVAAVLAVSVSYFWVL